MKAMILAAGRGERMRPLTDHTPKPLLLAGGKPLIVHHIEKLKAAGYHDLVVNTHHLAHQISTSLGDGSRWGVSIRYSHEHPQALETAGGIHKALPLLGNERFLVINGDVWCSHDLEPPAMNSDQLAHLILVDNPAHNPNGDFGLESGQINNQRRCTFSGIGWYRPSLFRALAPGPAALGPLLREQAAKGFIGGELFKGKWMDIGTPERLEQLNESLNNQAQN